MANDNRPPDQCGGVLVDGVCPWCGCEYYGDVPVRCDIARTDRPRKNVAPKITPINAMVVRVDCWNCGNYAAFNSMTHPQLWNDLCRGLTLMTRCESCGVGIDVQISSIAKPTQHDVRVLGRGKR